MAERSATSKVILHAAGGALFLAMAVGCLGAMVATLLKDDPYHVTLAYLAGFALFLEEAVDEHKRWCKARLQRRWDRAYEASRLRYSHRSAS